MVVGCMREISGDRSWESIDDGEWRRWTAAYSDGGDGANGQSQSYALHLRRMMTEEESAAVLYQGY